MRNGIGRDTAAMTGQVQGFELPMGCLMASVVILMVVVATAIGMASLI